MACINYRRICDRLQAEMRLLRVSPLLITLFAPAGQHVYSKGYDLTSASRRKCYVDGLSFRVRGVGGCYRLNRGLSRITRMTRILRFVSPDGIESRSGRYVYRNMWCLNVPAL